MYSSTLFEKLLISALEDAGYNSSTIFNYQGAVRRFKAFCEEHNVTEYSSDVGELYANDVISPKTGKFSKERWVIHVLIRISASLLKMMYLKCIPKNSFSSKNGRIIVKSIPDMDENGLSKLNI